MQLQCTTATLIIVCQLRLLCMLHTYVVLTLLAQQQWS
jgi:hypothetical protein